MIIHHRRDGRRGMVVAATWVAVSLWLSGVSAAGAETAAPTLGDAIEASQLGNQAAAQAQAIIEKLSNDADALAGEYRRTLQETQSLKVYNQQLAALLSSQDKEIASLDHQIEDVDALSRQIMPLMLRMIDTLDQFVALDVPFLPEERRTRVSGLREMMNRADVSLSEKYRRLLEAYQVENEYGRTIESYRGNLDVGQGSRTVDFLRVGRVALLYQTLDGQETGFWDVQRRQWVLLPGAYRGAVKQGLQIARKQVAPDLIRVPVSAPQAAQ